MMKTSCGMFPLLPSLPYKSFIWINTHRKSTMACSKFHRLVLLSLLSIVALAATTVAFVPTTSRSVSGPNTFSSTISKSFPTVGANSATQLSERQWNFNEGQSPWGMKTNAETWNGRVAQVRVAWAFSTKETALDLFLISFQSTFNTNGLILRSRWLSFQLRFKGRFCVGLPSGTCNRERSVAGYRRGQLVFLVQCRPLRDPSFWFNWMVGDPRWRRLHEGIECRKFFESNSLFLETMCVSRYKQKATNSSILFMLFEFDLCPVLLQ